MNVSPTVRQVQRLQPLHRRVTELYPCSRSFEATFTKDPTPLLGSHEAVALATHCSPVVVAAPLGQPRLDVKALRLLETAPGWDPGQALTASASDLKLHGTALERSWINTRALPHPWHKDPHFHTALDCRRQANELVARNIRSNVAATPTMTTQTLKAPPQDSNSRSGPFGLLRPWHDSPGPWDSCTARIRARYHHPAPGRGVYQLR